jgi:hypothetical protein
MRLSTETASDRPIEAEAVLPRLRCDHTAAALSTFAEAWLASAESRLSRRTYLSYRSTLRCYVLPVLGARSVPSLTGADIDALEVALIGDGLALGTVSNAISVLRLVLDDAEGLIPCNPAARANRPSLAAVPIGSEERVIPFRAARAAGVDLDTLRYWIKRGRVPIDDGRVLVADVERERDLKSATYAVYEAMRELRCDRRIVRRLTSLGELSPPISGRYQKNSVDRLARIFEADRTERISFNAAVGKYREAFRLTWSGLDQILEQERIPVVVRPWDGRATRLISRTVLEQALRRLKQDQKPCRCGCGFMPSLGANYLPGHATEVAVAKSLEREGLANRAASRRAWVNTSAADVWRASVRRERVERISCPCAICGMIELLPPSGIPAWGRTICDECWPVYRAALQRAKCVVGKISVEGVLDAADHDGFTKLLAVSHCGGPRLHLHERVTQLVQLRKEGRSITEMAAAVGLSEGAVRRELWQVDRGKLKPCCFEHAARARRPRKRGAQQPIGLDLAIASLHWAGFSDARTTALIRQAQRMGRLNIPRVNGLIHDGYVKQRRESRGIGRRPRGHGTTEDAKAILAEASAPLHVHEITRRIREMRSDEKGPLPDQNAVGTVLRRAARNGRIFLQTSPATFTLIDVPLPTEHNGRP